VINEEAAHKNLVYLRIEKDKALITNEIKKGMQLEHNSHHKFEADFEQYIQTHSIEVCRWISLALRR